MRRRRVLAFLAAFALAATACGDDGGGGGGDAQQGGPSTSSGPTTTKQPVPGGTLIFGNFSEPASLDNVVSTGSGTTGGTEMAAVYDTLMRYDPETGKYEGRTAESVTFTCWPPAPDARIVSIRISSLRISISMSSASGKTATVAADVWMRPPASVSGTRCTRCTPDSNLSLENTPLPETVAMISL